MLQVSLRLDPSLQRNRRPSRLSGAERLGNPRRSPALPLQKAVKKQTPQKNSIFRADHRYTLLSSSRFRLFVCFFFLKRTSDCDGSVRRPSSRRTRLLSAGQGSRCAALGSALKGHGHARDRGAHPGDVSARPRNSLTVNMRGSGGGCLCF